MRYSETLKSRPSRGQIEASDSSNSYLHLRSTMKLTSSLTTIVSLLALSVSAAKHPDNAPDGIYIEVVHANGTTVMEYYGPANTTAPAYALDKRDKDQGYPVCQRPAMAQERHCSRCERAQQFLRRRQCLLRKICLELPWRRGRVRMQLRQRTIDGCG